MALTHGRTPFRSKAPPLDPKSRQRAQVGTRVLRAKATTGFPQCPVVAFLLRPDHEAPQLQLRCNLRVISSILTLDTRETSWTNTPPNWRSFAKSWTL